MVWILLIIILVGASTYGAWRLLSRKMKAGGESMEQHLAAIREQKDKRLSALKTLASAILGYCRAGELEQIRSEVAVMEDKFNAEHGRLTITKAETEAVTQRLNDLKETDKELKSSLAEADREFAMLRAQEEEIKNQNAKLQDSLKDVLSKIDAIKVELKGVTAVQTNLDSAVQELKKAEGQFQFYEGELSQLNEKYINLKKAYDALDIEYAQLYERHNR